MAEPRIAFHKDLDELQSDLVLLGSMVDKAIYRSMDALVKSKNIPLAEKVIREDELINSRRFDIEDHALRLVALQAPMASTCGSSPPFSASLPTSSAWGPRRGIAKIVLLHDGVSPLQPLT